MIKQSENLLMEIEELKSRLAEAEQLIEAIKAGEVDAFAISRNNKPEIFTLESSDYAYRVLVENFNEGALNLSEDGLIVYTNKYFHELVGLPYENVIGSFISDFIDPSSKEEFNALFKKGLAGQSKGEINLSNGRRTIPVYVSFTSLYPQLPTVGVVVTDLTDKKKQEDILEQKNAELEKMNKELESFTYVSSHDLQEPLRKIQTFAGRLLEKEQQNLSDNGKDYFHRMQEAANRMQTLIQDLLAFSRINSAERKFEFTDLRKIVEEAKTDFKETIEEKHASIETEELHGEIPVIRFQFRQLLHNLIGNALKFSREGFQPHIIIKSEQLPSHASLKGHGKVCHITISDNGIGFEQHFAEQIFQLFQKLYGKDEYPGTGIGLAIVKKIVDNHHGIITATSELGKGARFDIYIPA